MTLIYIIIIYRFLYPALLYSLSIPTNQLLFSNLSPISKKQKKNKKKTKKKQKKTKKKEEKRRKRRKKKKKKKKRNLIFPSILLV